ncbi:hypothetical protein EW145_g985 [Phellinidium pouzarii]|uniref:RING-type E3 ubiquitin transferase n=1 Tax=Phellinidium pouzarii TaxID=167371 RepID=A0A4S4LGP8_9AGAM|nr:hypothetical protein EW145_g985 [Phellinidium pouzarii]
MSPVCHTMGLLSTMMMSVTTSPLTKRTNFESDSEFGDVGDKDAIFDDAEEEFDEEHCSICLQLFIDRAVISECSHEFCFDCILTWTDQSRRCPLCTRTIGPYLIHHIRSNFDYQKFHLPPLRSSPPPIRPIRSANRHSATRRSVQERQWGRREHRMRDVVDELERAIDKRRWVYQNHLYAKHVASNTFTRYRPFPIPVQFAASQDYISRATAFIRRELQVWVNLDVEFLTTFIISLMKALDIRSESAVKLLTEFLDMDTPYVEGNRFRNAEHFAHELYSYIRSPYKSLSTYDANVQYDTPKENHRLISTVVERAALPWNDRHRSKEVRHKSPRDGGDPSGSILNEYTSGSPRDGDIQSDCSNSLVTPSNGKGYEEGIQKPNIPPNASNRIAGVLLVTPPSHTTVYPPHRVSHAQSSSQRDRKGKQRATTDYVATPVTSSHAHASIVDPVFPTVSSEDTTNERKCEDGNSRIIAAGNIEVCRSFVVAENHSHQDSMTGFHSLESSADQLENPRRLQIRKRNPLLIAREHLTKASADAGTETLIKPRGDITTDNGASYPDGRIGLRENSLHIGRRPSLLSRITDPLFTTAEIYPALTATTVADPIRSSDVRPDHAKINGPMDQATDRGSNIQDSSQRTAESRSSESTVTNRNELGLRLRLLRRLEAERAKQHIAQALSGFDGIEAKKGDSDADLTTSSHSDTSHFASDPIGRKRLLNDRAATLLDDAHGTVETEAKLRARVRLRMKLAAEKCAQSPALRGDRISQRPTNEEEDGLGKEGS